MNTITKLLVLGALDGGGSPGAAYRNQIIATAPIAYWPLNELSGAAAINYGSLGTAANGAYSGVTLANADAPGGGKAPYWDGANDYCDIYSAALAGAFNGSVGTLSTWIKCDNAYDGTRIVARIMADGNNVIDFRTEVTPRVSSYYVAGGTSENIFYNTSSLDWLHVVITWTLPGANQAINYINGSANGAPSGTLGTWAGALGANTCLLGAGSKTPVNVLKGWLAHPAIWTRVLSAAEVLALYNGGI